MHSWTGLLPVHGVGTATMSARNASLTVTPDGSAQLVAIGDDGNVYHRIRNAAGSWSPFQPVAGAGGASTFSAPRVRIAALPDGSAQLLVTSC
ncbi:hypothetical protein [Streptomyces sp. NPDC058412]|uniref:hypothetical protein n=1 Tax=Streptomyces sp. NPDC058412 TaxID=3346486 RepID=UPI003647B4FA